MLSSVSGPETTSRATMLKLIGLALAGAPVIGMAAADTANAATDVYMPIYMQNDAFKGIKLLAPSQALNVFITEKGGTLMGQTVRPSEGARLQSKLGVSPLKIMVGPGGMVTLGLSKGSLSGSTKNFEGQQYLNAGGGVQ
jgi:hypothetical protein